jgi:hypothetical protein
MSEEEFFQQQLDEQEQLMESVHKKLVAVQCELKAPKNQFNDFGKYKYRSCEDILEAVKPLLKKHGLAMYISDDIMQMGQRFYIESTATLVCIDTGQKIEATAVAREPESKKGADESQITGATSSYCRKYLLNGLFLIDDTKDSDATNTHDKETTKKAQPLDMDKVLKALNSAKDLKDLDGYYRLALPRATPEQKEIIDFTYSNIKESFNG